MLLPNTSLLRIAELRDKQRRGEQLSIDECKEVIILLRQERSMTPQAKAGSKAKKTTPAKTGDDLLKELDGL